MAEVAVANIDELKNNFTSAEKAYEEAKQTLAEQKAGEMNILKEQFDASTDMVFNALNTLSLQMDVASTKGKIKGVQIVGNFGGADTKLNGFTKDLGSLLGSTVATGGLVGLMPMVTMAGAVRGVYRKIID
ncbi:hypothetical protein ThvES_00008820 [Thiovulum sp. ES]|nr:hypothetical protein ThvES_00008820 [Thiovulum sp. ES]